MLRHVFKEIDFSLAEIHEWFDLVPRHDTVILHWTIWSAAVGTVEQGEVRKHSGGRFGGHQGLCKVENPIKKQELFLSLPN